MNDTPQNPAPKPAPKPAAKPTAKPTAKLAAKASKQAAGPLAADRATPPVRQPDIAAPSGVAPTGTPAAAAGQPLLDGYAGDATAQGKKWLESADLGQLTTQLPQALRRLGSKLAAGVRGLSTAQKVVGGAALAVGLGWLATRRRRPAPAAIAEASNSYREKFDGRPFGGRGKPRYASSADQPAYGRSGKY